MFKLALGSTVSLAASAIAAAAIAATQSSTFNNQLTSSVAASNITSGYSVTSPIASGRSGSGSFTTSSNPNITTSVRYTTSGGSGCTFTGQASFNSATSRYTFSSGATPFSVPQATCSSTILSSNSATGDFSVSYSLSGF